MQKRPIKSIIRHHRQQNFVIVSRGIVDDPNLSWKAKGLMMYLLAQSDGWQFYESEIVTRGKDGKDGVASGLIELEKAGYLRRTWLRGDKGQYIGREWEVFGNPVMTDGLTDSGFSVSGEAVSGKPGTNKNNNNKINNNREEEETKIAEEQKEVLPTSNSDYEPEVNAPPHSYPDSFYEEPASPQQIHGSNSKDLIEAVKKKLGIEDTLAFLLVARCQDKLDNVIDQLVNAKKPIQNMTAYLLTLMSRPEQWDLFIENVENGFLTKERPKKKRRELKPKYLEEEREIYIPPSARNG